MKQKISAQELLFRLKKGERRFSGLTVIGDLTWDMPGEPSVSKNYLTFSLMEFTGECYLGDLYVESLKLEDSIFHQRCAIYRTDAQKMDSKHACFHRGLGLINFSSQFADLRYARFLKPPLGLPGGLTVRKSRIHTLALNKVESCQTTIDKESSIANILKPDANLGRRTPTRLKELQAA